MEVNLTIPGTTTGLNGTSNNETFAAPVFPAYIRPAATVLCSLVMTIGVLGNVMVLLVIFKSKDMRSSTNIFLMNLSVADLLILLVCTPTVLVEVNSKPETWVLGEEMCKAVPFIETTVSHASVLTILAISFERYYAICEPLRAGYVCTKARAFFICVCAWAVAAVLTSPMLLIPKYGLEEQKDGTKVIACLMPVDTLWQRLFYYVSILIFFWVPFIVLIVLYFIIAIRLMADPGVKLQGNDTFNHRARRQLVLMLGTVVLLFFLCLMPFRVFLLWYIAAPGQSVMDLGVERYFNILNFCRVMFYVNSAVNPIIYNLMSSKFRDGFLRLCSARSNRYFLRHRRWEISGSTATCSLSYSNSRRDWEFNRRSRSQTLARELPFTRRLTDMTPMLHRAYVPEDRLSEGSGSPRAESFKDLATNNDSRVSTALSEYDNLDSPIRLSHSKSETEFTTLVAKKSELKPPDRGKSAELDMHEEAFPTEGEESPFKYRESIRKSLMKSNIRKKISRGESDEVNTVVIIENGDSYGELNSQV